MPFNAGNDTKNDLDSIRLSEYNKVRLNKNFGETKYA